MLQTFDTPLLIIGPYLIFRADKPKANRYYYVTRDGKVIQWHTTIEDVVTWLNASVKV